jgi:hypothetical protein
MLSVLLWTTHVHAAAPSAFGAQLEIQVADANGVDRSDRDSGGAHGGAFNDCAVCQALTVAAGGPAGSVQIVRPTSVLNSLRETLCVVPSRLNQSFCWQSRAPPL